MTKKYEYLSVKQFAEAIGVSPITVRRWDLNHMKNKPHALHRTGLGHRVYTIKQVTEYKRTQQDGSHSVHKTRRR